MALIKCIECGNQISSFAMQCPYCGCPSSHQQTNNENELNYTDDCNAPPIKNLDKWNMALELLKQKKGQESVKIVEEILGKSWDTDLILGELCLNKEIPVDLILEKFPDQAARPITKKPEPTTKPCSACGKTISVKAETCPHCGQPTGVHVCPRCGSTNVVYIDAISKAASMAFFGLFSVNTVKNTYECWDCHFKF